MTAADLISDLATRGVELTAHGDKLRFRPVERLTPVDVDLLRQHKAVILGLLRSEGREAAPLDLWPIVPGHRHWNPYVDPADLDAGRWGEEFIPGYHIDIRQPSTLRPLCDGRLSWKATP